MRFRSDPANMIRASIAPVSTRFTPEGKGSRVLNPALTTLAPRG